MDSIIVFPVGSSNSIQCAASLLSNAGITLIDHPSPDVTHLLADIPTPASFYDNTLLSILPDQITIIGGNLHQFLKTSYHVTDLLTDSSYLWQNAALTAQCAVLLCQESLPRTLADSNILILGWGRIAKMLAKLLAAFHSTIYVYSRSNEHLAEIQAFGYHSVSPEQLAGNISYQHLIINTAPGICLPSPLFNRFHGAVIDLASKSDINFSRIINAKGLPNRIAPESSGKLIADTILRILKEEET